MKIVLDAMGGDVGIEVNMAGAYIASKKLNDDDTIIFVGDKKLIEKYLKEKYKDFSVKYEIVESENDVSMDDTPTWALENKKNSSIAKGLELVKEKKADAFFSPGNTGVILAFSLTKVGRIKGVIRPALGFTFPIGKHPLILDLGATPDPKPENLYQFALLGSEYMKIMRGIEKPLVGLLSIGEEDSKGSVIYQKAFELISKDKNINFFGNIEGGDFFTDKVDVIVTDGFTGNIVLKFAEGMIHWVKDNLKTSLKPLPVAILGLTLSAPGFLGLPFFYFSIKKFLKKASYDEYGGAPLLGINGVVLIGHGKSNPKAVASGIMNAKYLASKNLVEDLKGIFERSESEEN
ncbi:MAG: phosphate acyltransferase PlsX [candidate division WOR-3 bacterium]